MINREYLLEMIEEAPPVALTAAEMADVLGYIVDAGDQGVSGREILAYLRNELDVPPDALQGTLAQVVAKLAKAGDIEEFSRKVVAKKVA